MAFQIILAIIEIFGLFTIGAIARRLDYIRETEIDRWTKMVLDFFIPIFTFTTIIKGVSRENMGELWLLPVIGFIQIAIPTAAGFIFQFGLGKQHSNKRRSFLHFCNFNNYTYLPVIVFRNLWGDESLSMLFLMAIGSHIGVWTLGVAVLNVTDLKSALKNIITPNLVAIIGALVIALTCGSNAIPPLVLRILSSAGSVAIPLILMLIGSSLVKRGTLHLSWPVIYIAILRLIVLPCMMLPLLKLLPLSESVFAASVLISLMPVAIATVVMTRRFGGDPDYAASAALVTTLFSIATVPLGFWLFVRY